ncbi:MAG: ABC transporter ATP-binding protein [Clostridia bacterium]
MQTVLTLKNINKSFGKKKIIDNISLDVNAGEVLGFLGPNGAGKTTTIKMIMGFLSVDSGEITICGANLKQNYEKAMSYLGGIVENPEMYKEITGRKNLEMYAKLHNGVTKERIDEVIKLVGMEKRIDEKVKKYSLGMKQRAGLAQAILHKPKILILDEPTNGLDPAGIRELRDILKHLAYDENTAVFVSSHMLSEMELMCDRIAIVENGKLIDIKLINDLLKTARGDNSYKFYTKQVEKAKEVLALEHSDKTLFVGEDFITLKIEESEVPSFIKLFVMSDIALFGVNRTEVSLEDAFINITGGGNTIA